MGKLDILKCPLLLARHRSNQWKPRAELEEMQEEGLRRLVAYAKERVPHYRRAYRGLSVRGLDDLRSLPETAKDALRSEPLSFVNDALDIGSLNRVSTSGSSGVPLSMYHSGEEAIFGPVQEIFMLGEAGVGPFDLQANVTHYPQKVRMLQRLGLFRRKNLPLADPVSCAKALSASPSCAVLGFPSALSTTVDRAEGAGLQLKAKRVFTYGEVLHDDERTRLQDAFSAKVADWYGVVETGWVAWECEEGSLHLNSDSVLAEVVDGNGDPSREGEEGDLLLTSLWRRAMPIIRYRVGDRGAFGSRCRCGRGLHTLKPIGGRSDDFIRLADGTRLSPRILPCFMVDIDGIAEYQIVQEATDRFIFRYVPSSGFVAGAVEKVFKEHLGKEISVEFQELDSLPRGNSGKFKKVISKVD